MPLTGDELNNLLNPLGDGPIKKVLVEYSLKCEHVYTSSSIIGFVSTCRTPCHWTFKGQPLCTIHVLRVVNELLVEKGIVA